MSTQDIVESFIQQCREEGRQEGRQEGLMEAILTLYKLRFGAPSAEITAAIQSSHDLSTLRDWLRIVGERSLEDVMAALRSAKTNSH